MKTSVYILALSFLFLTNCAVAPKKINKIMKNQDIKTYGVHHVGLSVKDLKTTSEFFTKALQFKKVKEKPDYPAHFVTDGNNLITLWQVTDSTKATPFNRKENIGLHHLAFKLKSFEDLDKMYAKLKNWPGVKFQFSPELVGKGPAKHMIFFEPGGIRLEFIVIP